MRNVVSLAAAALLLLTSGHASAQQRRFAPQQINPNVQPAFHVTPIIHQFEARRGKVISFEYAIESIDRPTTVKVRPVALRQDDKGTILPAAEAPPPDNLTLLSPGEMNLADNETRLIRGRLRVPFSDSKFHSYGILVTDLGRIVGSAPLGTQNAEERRVGIRFVTRYLLRCDITVQGVRGGDITKLDIESAELNETGGHAQARVWISNPTDSPFEFQVQCRLARPSQSTRQKPFHLCMPVRELLEPPERWDIRILPRARIQLVEQLPEAVFPGDYEIEVDLISNRRSRIKKSFPLAIEEGEFPAQDATIVQVARDITAAPAQLELSLRRRGKRFLALEVANSSQQAVDVKLTPVAPDDDAEWLLVRPPTVSLYPGAKRKVLVTLAAGIDVDRHRYGAIRVDVTHEQGAAIGHFDVPVALVSRSEENPQLELDALSWEAAGDRPSLVLPVANRGAMHLPLDARLTLTDGFGRTVELQAGFGRWLMPGEQSQLRFATRFAPPPGEYYYKLRVSTGADREPIEVENTIRIPGAAADPSAAVPD